MHIALLTDFPAVAFANGVSLATRSLKRHLEMRGHRVTIVGPRPARENPKPDVDSLLLNSAPFLAHPGVNLAFAWPPSSFSNHGRDFDVIHSQANSMLIHWAPVMRALHRVPCLSTHTLYTPGFVHHALPKALIRHAVVRKHFAGAPARAVDRLLSQAYSGGDGLIVQCDGMARYWENLGISVPLHVIPRPIDTTIFERPVGADPFRHDFAPGKRIILVARHAKEKNIGAVLNAFAKSILTKHKDASLTLVGNGQEHKALVAHAESLGISGRVDFCGEKPHKDLRDYYAHADLFMYASMTETYGQVIAEALWCGVPVVALDDEMGVAFQVEHERNGLLVPAGPEEELRLGEAAAALLADAKRRNALGRYASKRARARVAPEVIYKQYEDAYGLAREHLEAHPPDEFSPRSLLGWGSLLNRFLAPWTFQQAALCTLGVLGAWGNTYRLPAHGIGDFPEQAPTGSGHLRANGRVPENRHANSYTRHTAS
jgi:glycosyltransferase involved in cell wall biosynthesis